MEGLRHELFVFWIRLRLAWPWLAELEDWLRTSEGRAIALGALALMVALVVAGNRWRRTAPARAARRDAAREIRARARAGDWRGVGECFARLGNVRRAVGSYLRGGHHREAAQLLIAQGRRRRARKIAREGEAWGLYARLCAEDGDHEAAAEAYLADGQTHAAASAFAQAGRPLQAARAYARAGLTEQALTALLDAGDAIDVELLERLLRGAQSRAGETVPGSLDDRALRRAVRLRLDAGDFRRAYRLAADRGRWDLALPIAREHLPPSPEIADACARQGAHLEAAELYQRLGDDEQAARQRAEHHLSRDQPAEAAACFERAGQWDLAAEQWQGAGELGRAAAAYVEAGDYRRAAELYGTLGDPARRGDLLARAAATDPRARVADPVPVDPAAPTSILGRGVPPGAAPGPEGAVAGAAVAGAAPAGAIDGDGRYRLEGELGRGAMGIVYRAHDGVLARRVAVKLLPRELSGESGEEVLVEARSAARLQHPNIVQVFDAGHGPRGYFIVMELVEGRTFDQVLAEGRLSLAALVRVGRQICAALAHAHDRHIVHRDLKPSNLLWTEDDEIKLTDFGLARKFAAAREGVETRPAGTPCYMAPEQIQGATIGPRSDLYSLGCVLYELVAGHPPFAGQRVIYDHLNTRPADLDATRRHLPPALAEVILRCLAKDPEDRPGSAAEIDRVLASVSG